jgi:Carboxypeptidase regulatory-like domain/PDZ domain
VKTKSQVVWVVVIVLALMLAGGLALWWLTRGDRAPSPVSSPVVATKSTPPSRASKARPPAQAARPSDADSGVIDGRVLDGMTHEGVPNAELTFLGDGAVSTFRASSDGTFVLTPSVTGSFVLSTITAPGYLPYASDLGRSGVHVTLAHGQAIHGVTLLLYPAVDYQGLVIDARGAPVAGARVRLLGSPAGEAMPENLAAEWKTGSDGHFTFQAADDFVLEASHGTTRGWAHVDRNVKILKTLTIQLGHSPPNDATITGRVHDPSGAPIADAMVRAAPSIRFGNVGTVFATTGPDGTFRLAGVDRASYDLIAEATEHVRAVRSNILGGSRDIELTLDAGLPLAGQVVDSRGAPVPVFTLLVRRRAGAARPVVATQSLIDPQGRFAVRVPQGDYELLASAQAWARSTPVEAAAGTTDVRVVLGSGATLRGKVVAIDDHTPIGNARVTCETPGGGTSVLLAEPGAVTRPDGTFELTGISAGPLSIWVRAEGYYAKIEAAMTARDDAVLGPLTVELTRVDPEEATLTELVGIGVNLSPDGDALLVTRVLPGSGAFDVGLGFGDRVVAIDGLPVAPLGVEGAIARIRGVAGTTVTLTLRRDGQDVQLIVERRKLWARPPRTG